MSILSLFAALVCALSIILFIIFLGAFIRIRQLLSIKARVPIQELSLEPDGVEKIVEMKDGTKIRCLHKGSGHTVVLLHDLGGSVVTMNRLWRLLAAHGFRVITFDFRGHGKSGIGKEGMGIQQMTDDLQQVLEFFKAKDATLVGHSWGAFISFSYLTNRKYIHTGKVQGVISVSGFAGNMLVPAVKKPLLRRLFGWKTFQKMLKKRIYGWTFASPFFGEEVDPALLEVFLDIYSARPLKRLFPLLEEQANEDLYERLKLLTVPVGVISGKQDQIMDPAISQKLINNISNLKGQVFDDHAGHMLVWESPSTIVEMVRAMAYQREFSLD